MVVERYQQEFTFKSRCFCESFATFLTSLWDFTPAKTLDLLLVDIVI